MNQKSKFHQFISLAVSLGLLLQLIMPIGAIAAQPLAQDPIPTTVTSEAETAVSTTNQSAVSSPIAIAKAQSSYQAGGDLTVTYTVRNNQSAVNLPNIEPGLNLTDTVSALSGFDPLADPNTLRNVIVSANLTNGATFLDSSIWPDTDGSQMLFALGDLAPRASATFTFSMSSPAATSDFLELDSGAVAYATFQGRAATAVAPPIRLAPDGFANWLIKTPDADRDDEAMLFQAAEIGDDPLALFDFVQNLSYEAYDGSLRGTRGALWSEAANSADQASLLIAMLRGSGYPARYRHGVLPQAEAQTLIASMFDMTTAVRGHVPATATVSDPLNDPELLSFAQDHWWVEAYLPGNGWTNLDPVIAAATPGDTFAAPAADGSDKIAELPDAIRHKLSFTLDVEKYNSFPLGGLNLTEMTVLTATIPTAQAAGTPVNIAFSVQSQVLNGMVYASAEHTYTPYLTYGGGTETIFGDTFQDLLTSFPLATNYTIAIWLDVVSTAPDGSSDTYRRTIKDLVGVDLRQGGTSQLEPRDNSPLISNSDLMQVQPIPNSAYPADEVDRIFHSIYQQVPTMIAAYESYAQLDESSGADEIFPFADDQLPALYEAQFTQLDLMSAMFQFGSTWAGEAINAETMLVKSYPDRPKLILSSQIGSADGSLKTSFELLNIDERAIAYPGQNLEAVKSANFLRTTSEKAQEYELLSLFLPGETRSAVRTLIVAAEQDIPTRFIVAENLAELDDLAIPAETKARIVNYVSDGSLVSVPEQMVTMPYGEDIGFMVVAPDGNASYVNADGYMASAALFYAIQNQEVIMVALIQGTGLAFVGGFFSYILAFFAEVFLFVIGIPPLKLEDISGVAAGAANGKSTILGLILAAKAAIPVPLGACGLTPNPPGCQGGVIAGYGFVITALVAGLAGGGLDPSLTDFWVSDLPLPEPATVSTMTVTAVPTLSGSVTLDITAGHYWGASANLSSDWISSHTQTAPFATLSAAADLSRNGVALGSGNLTATDGQIQFNDVSRHWTLTGSSSAAGYASAANGLALAQVGDYVATASGNPDLSGQLRSGYATLNNTPITGDLDVVFNSDAALSGAGAAPSPYFAAAHTLELAQGQFLVSDIDSGVMSVGGTAVNGVQSIALSEYTGSVTLSDSGNVDQITLNGAADFFALTVVPDTTNAVVNDSILITPDLLSNYNDTYTVTVNVPDGWTTAAASGGILVTPSAKAETGSADILVTAQSAAHPDLFSSAIVSLALAENQAVDVTVLPDPLITVPMGTPQGSDYDTPLTWNHAGDGRAEVSGAAFNVIVRNDSTAAATFDLAVAGLPANWVLWSLDSGTQTSLTLAAGAQQTIGLYVVPPDAPLLTAGTAHPFTVTATDQANGSVADSDSGIFTMPALSFPYLTADPLVHTASPDEIVTVPVTLQNVGNTAASFPITVTVRNNHFSTADMASTVLLSVATMDTGTLAPNASFTTDIVITTTGAIPGSVFFVQAQSAAGEYTPMAMAAVEIVSLLTEPIYDAGNSCNLGREALSVSFEALAYAVTKLENSCNGGSCDLAWRDAAATAAENVALQASITDSDLSYAALEAIAATMASHSDLADLQTDMMDLSAAVEHLSLELCDLEDHQPSARFTPYVAAILLGDSADFSLDVTNAGMISTTYAITVTGLPNGDLFFNESINPGDTASIPVNSTPATLGVFDLAATITAVGAYALTPQATAVARLHVVDKFVQVTAVLPDPAFVETGTSSSTISAEIANVSGVVQVGNARTAVLAPNGSSLWTTDTPVNVRVGNPRLYELGTVDTSGWAAGVYTVTVDLLDDGDALIPEGSGYGYLSVGQALGASHAVAPTLVPPGTVTVTTVITTEIMAGPISLGSEAKPMPWPATGLRSGEAVDSEQSTVDSEQSTVDGEQSTVDGEQLTEESEQSLIFNLPSPNTITGTIILRYEQDEAALTGTWASVNESRASNGSYLRADALGETAVFNFTGTWVNLGFIGDRYSGQAEIFIDGVSEGILDLYRHDTTAVSFVYDGLSAGAHTLTVTALNSANPQANNDYVQLDYLDVYNGGSYADGSFEETDSRLFLGTGWSNIPDANASGGSYNRGSAATTWLPFTGDSVTYQALAYSAGGKVDLSIDGVYTTTLNLYNPLVSITRTLSFDGLGAGPHVLQVSSYRGNATVDAFVTPGSAPFYTPPTLGSFTRYEEENPAFLYNGVPYTLTSQSWTRNDASAQSEASDGQRLYSRTANDTANLTFDGVWASVGFFTDDKSGQAEIFVDGLSQGVVDLYSHEEDVVSFTFDGLSAGSHTLSVTVLGTSNPLAGNQNVNLDYVDVWDGNSLPDGLFEQLNGRVLRSGNWRDVAAANASGGSYSDGGESTAWFPFTGDSVTYQAWEEPRSDKVALYIDEVFQGYYDIRTGTTPTITYSFDNLGAGLHMFKLRDYRDEPTLDAFITPAISAPTPPPAAQVFSRHEEDDPAIRYNGLPYKQAAGSWSRINNIFSVRASDGQYIISSTPGDVVSLDFNGTWVGVGFATNFRSGQVEVFIDGISQGIVDLYSRDDDVAAFIYSGLADSAHTISAIILPTKHPNATGTQVMVDYFDTWNGSPLAAGTYEETHPLLYRGDRYDDWPAIADAAASGGSYIRGPFQHESALWFPFTGDSITFLGLANNNSDYIEIAIDGVNQGTFNLYNTTPITRSFSFAGLGSGPHVMQIQHTQGYVTADAFVVPGIAPFYQPPVSTGVVRYEEAHPDLRYNTLYDFQTRPQSWYVTKTTPTVSGEWHTTSSNVGDAVSLTFNGRWAAVGFRVRNEAGEAEVFIDGASQGIINVDNDPGEDVRFYPFGDLITGTHTISVSVVSGAVYFDYFDVWDGQPMSDDLLNASRAEDNGRLHYTYYLQDATHPNAIEGDMVVPSLWNADSNIWYSFVGTSFDLLGVTRNNISNGDVFIDGVLVETADFNYPFSEQPRTFHYNGLADGPHVVRINNNASLRVDAFQANPAQPTPYLPLAEWWDNAPRGTSGAFGTPAGMIMGIAAGDLDGDGEVEIVAPSDTFTENGNGFMNSIFIYRGDGEDAGNGSPLIRRIDFPALGDQVGREYIGSVALADLDGLPGSEIIIGSERGMYAFFNTGVTYWFTDTFHGPGNATVVTPAVGNLDLDAAPEIVVNMTNELVVYTAAGDIAWSDTLPAEVGMPLLADMTGDGRLDIVAYDANGGVRLYDYNLGAPQLLWQTALSSTVGIVRGGPAIADVNGDGSPDIAISHNGYHTVLDAAGNVIWSTELDPGEPGGVSVADIDGDGEIEIVTGMLYDDGIGVGRLYALNADGSILWERPAYDDTSANSQSVLDLNGDGIYEIAWNGAQYGFTIFNGADGEILFNEPLAESLTATDYPIFADVDLDGYAEIVVPSNDGIVVFGQDGVWGESRPVWNQHSYHITNVNIDLTIPEVEADSWAVHNTYRTQWPQDIVIPVYDVVVTHTVGLDDVAVLTDTFSAPPTVDSDPVYGWDYVQLGTQPVITRTFASVLTNLEPGETRMVAQETAVSYTFPSGSNQLTLPPLYVTAAHLGELTPLEQSIPAGGTAVYSLTLTNPANTADTIALSMSGVPSDWLDYPASAALNPGETVIVPLTVNVPSGAGADVLPLFLDLSNSSGGSDSLQAILTIFDGLDVALTPASQTALPGETAVYALTLSNHEPISRTYTFTSSGQLNLDVPVSLTVAANGEETAVITATASIPGPQPFTIFATASSGGADSADAVLEVAAIPQAGLVLAPDPAVTGPGSTAVITLTVTNLGDLAETFDLDVTLPAGWSHQLQRHGSAVNEIYLPSGSFNTRDLTLLVTPDDGAAIADYDVVVTATAQSINAIAGTTTGTVEVSDLGVQIEIVSGPSSLDPRDAASWNIQVTNMGSVAETFDLQVAGGIFALAGQFSTDAVTLNPGQAQTVQLTADNFDFMMPSVASLVVAAIAQSDDRVADEDVRNVELTAYEGVDVGWLPAAQTVTNTLTAQFMMVITNTGNVLTSYDLETAVPGATSDLPTRQILLPAHSSRYVMISVNAPEAGIYTLTGTADSTSSGATDSAPATLTIIITNHAPLVDAGAGKMVNEGTAVAFNGTASDPDNDPLSILWHFGDGGTATGSLTPSHTFGDNGVYNVTLTVTDTGSLASTDNVLITINNVAPSVNAGADRTGSLNQAIQFNGTFTDPGTLDTHTIVWDFGDGTTGSGSLTPNHSYTASGEYTVTLTVTDDDGGVSSDTLTVMVAYQVLLPVILKP